LEIFYRGIQSNHVSLRKTLQHFNEKLLFDTYVIKTGPVLLIPETYYQLKKKTNKNYIRHEQYKNSNKPFDDAEYIAKIGLIDASERP